MAWGRGIVHKPYELIPSRPMLDPDRKTVFPSHQNTIGNAPKQWSAAPVRVTDVIVPQVSDPLSLWVGVAAWITNPTD